MEHTFFLKNPQGRVGTKKSPIIFSCYFHEEKKQFKYSTGEKIAPIHWDFENNQPLSKGKHKAENGSNVESSLRKISVAFEEIERHYFKLGEELTSQILKQELDIVFEKAVPFQGGFMEVYDKFMDEKIKRKEWKPATIKRYANIKNLLLDFESNYLNEQLTFKQINSRFFTEFTNFCYTIRDHSTNTFARNIGLFLSFMIWATNKKYNFNPAFKEYRKPERVITKEVALSEEEVSQILQFNPEHPYLERARDVFVFQCMTGLRNGELRMVNKQTTRDNMLLLKEEKDVNKESRRIPLNAIAVYILQKYDYKLPLISNQKQNDYLKVLFKDAGFLHEVETIRTKSKEIKRGTAHYYEMISTHTARRTFITMMKKKGIADKTIMEMTGHKDLKTFNSYYKVDDHAKVDAMEMVFGGIELPI